MSFKFNKFSNKIFKNNFLIKKLRFCSSPLSKEPSQAIGIEPNKMGMKSIFKYLLQFTAFSTVIGTSILLSNKNSKIFLGQSKEKDDDLNRQYNFNLTKVINLAIASIIAKNFFGIQSQYFANKIDQINPDFFLGDYLRAMELRQQSESDPSKW